MLMLQFIIDVGISATSFTTAATHDNIEEDRPTAKCHRYESSRIKKARVAAGHIVNGTDATSTTDAASTSTATTR